MLIKISNNLNRKDINFITDIDKKSKFADWSTSNDIKSQLEMDLTVLLYNNGYPPTWNGEVFKKVMEQAENFKKYND